MTNSDKIRRANETDAAAAAVLPELVPVAVLDRGRIGMLAFLASEAAFFSTLIVAYIVYMGRTTDGPTPAVLRLPIAIGGTICLVASSLTVHLAASALRRGWRRAFYLAWGITILLGIAFLAGTAVEWANLIGMHGLTISRNLFGTTYYTLVGFHAAHVTIGVLLMSVWLLIALFGASLSVTSERTEVISYYWHFVDGVWIVVFTLVYLLSR